MPERDWEKDWELVIRVAATKPPSWDDDFIKQIGEVLLALHFWLQRVRGLEEVFTKVTHELKEECYECCDGEQDHETCWVENCRIKRAISMLDAELGTREESES